MDSSARREKILQILQESSSAVTGTALSKACNVSRQIIVGDVAILRAQGIAIISTPGLISWSHRPHRAVRGSSSAAMAAI